MTAKETYERIITTALEIGADNTEETKDRVAALNTAMGAAGALHWQEVDTSCQPPSGAAAAPADAPAS